MKIHPTTWLVIAITVLTAHFQEMLMLLTIIIVHELGHAVGAAYFKWRIKSITILPFGGMVETEEYGNRTLREDLIVTILGPLQHLWLFLIAFLLYSIGIMEQSTFSTFVYVNGAVCLFNLLPIWPLDGGKLLFLLLSLRYSFLHSHRLILQSSFITGSLFMLCWLLFAPFSLNVVIIFAFILFK